jgi:glycosyltransferase involved in cell wall biosynthesis
MKIAFVYDAVYPFMAGGGEKRYWEIATRLAELGHEVTLVCAQAWIGEPVRTEKGISYVAVSPNRPLFTASGTRALVPPLSFAWGVYKHLRHARYDVVDCCSFPLLSSFACKWALPHKTPLVLTWFEVRDLRGWIRYTGFFGIAAYILQRMAAVLTKHHIAISEFTRIEASRLLSIPAQKCEVIPGGVNCAEYTPLGNELRRRRLVFVGRLVPHKQADMLIRAFLAISEEFPDLTLSIVGTGTEAEALANLAQRSAAAERIIFHGLIPQAELVNIYRTCLALVLPSEQEGFGMVLVEAMAAGAPVLALSSSRSAASEVLEDGKAGMIFRDETDLVTVLRRLLLDGELRQRLRIEGFRRASTYDWMTSVAPSALTFYRAVVKHV